MIDIEGRIKEYESKGWKIEGLDTEDEGYVMTPEGDVFYYYDLIFNICPICSKLEGEEEGWCDGKGHDEKLLKRVEEAEKLAELIQQKRRNDLLKIL
jgi:hypothetical protein